MKGLKNYMRRMYRKLEWYWIDRGRSRFIVKMYGLKKIPVVLGTMLFVALLWMSATNRQEFQVPLVTSYWATDEYFVEMQGHLKCKPQGLVPWGWHPNELMAKCTMVSTRTNVFGEVTSDVVGDQEYPYSKFVQGSKYIGYLFLLLGNDVKKPAGIDYTPDEKTVEGILEAIASPKTYLIPIDVLRAGNHSSWQLEVLKAIKWLHSLKKFYENAITGTPQCILNTNGEVLPQPCPISAISGELILMEMIGFEYKITSYGGERVVWTVIEW